MSLSGSGDAPGTARPRCRLRRPGGGAEGGEGQVRGVEYGAVREGPDAPARLLQP